MGSQIALEFSASTQHRPGEMSTAASEHTARFTPQEVRGVLGEDIGYCKRQAVGPREHKRIFLSRLPDPNEHAKPEQSPDEVPESAESATPSSMTIHKSGAVTVLLS